MQYFYNAVSQISTDGKYVNEYKKQLINKKKNDYYSRIRQAYMHIYIHVTLITYIFG